MDGRPIMTVSMSPRPDALTFRIVGAVFWLGLLVYFVPHWFVSPVEFSPETARVKTPSSSITVVETVTQSMAATVVETQTNAAESIGRSELYIEKPLTTTPPPADPDRVLALNQPVTVREAQTDHLGRLKASTSNARLTEGAPAISPSGTVWVQVATYAVESVALTSQAKMKASGFSGKLVAFTNKKGKLSYQLRIGPYKNRADAQKVKYILDARFNSKSVVIGK